MRFPLFFAIMLWMSGASAQADEGLGRERRDWVEAGFRATEVVVRTYRRCPQFGEHSDRARAFIDRLVDVLDSFQVRHEWRSDLDDYEVSQREGSRLMLTPGYVGEGEVGSDLAPSSIFDPILINHRDFHQERRPLDFVDLIKLIIHELGHKTGELDRGFRDRVAQDIADYIRPWFRTKELTPSASIEVLSIPSHLIQEAFEDHGEKPGLQPTFWAFVHRSQGATDITPLLVESWERIRHSMGGVYAVAQEFMFLQTREIEKIKPQMFEDLKRKFRAGAMAELQRRRIHMTPEEIAQADVQLEEQVQAMSRKFKTEMRTLHLVDFLEVKSAALEDRAHIVRLRGGYTLSRTDRDLINLQDTSGASGNMPYVDSESNPVRMEFVVRLDEQDPVRPEEITTLSFPVPDFSGTARMTARRRGQDLSLVAKLPVELGPTTASFMIRYAGGFLLSPAQLLRASEDERGQPVLELEWEVPPEYRSSERPMVVDSVLVDGHRMVFLKNSFALSENPQAGFRPRAGMDQGIVPGSLGVRMMRAVKGDRPQDFFETEFSATKPVMALEGSLFDVPSIDPSQFVAGFRFRGNPEDIRQIRLYMRRELYLSRPLSEAEHREEHGDAPRPSLDDLLFRSFVDGQFREFLKHGKAFKRTEVPEILNFQDEQVTYRRLASGEYFVQVQARVPFRDPYPNKPPGTYLVPPAWSFFAFEAVEANGRTHIEPFKSKADCEINFQKNVHWETDVSFN